MQKKFSSAKRGRHMTDKSHSPATTWRQKQKEEIRKVILQNALLLFEERGFQRTTIRLVAERAGIGVGTIFNHYPDKSSLLVAALIDELDRKQEEAFKTMPNKGSVRDILLHIARTFYLYYAKRPELSRTLLKEMQFISGKWGEALNIQAFEFFDRIGDILRVAQQKGEIRKDADCNLAAMAFFSHYLNALFMGLRESEFNVEGTLQFLDLIITQMFEGIGGKREGL